MKGKNIVITGASRGLGKAMAEVAMKRGAKVMASARSEKDLEALAKEIGAVPFKADVTKEKEMIALAKAAVKEFGHIDIWINNAGVWLPRGPIEDADMDRAHELIEVNLFGTMYGTRAILPYFKEKGSGIIVNVVSTAALVGRPNSCVYSASKWAARGFTDSLREEVKAMGIKVIGIYPGGIKTDLFNEQKPSEYDDFMDPYETAVKILDNLAKQDPDVEMVLKRPGQS